MFASQVTQVIAQTANQYSDFASLHNNVLARSGDALNEKAIELFQVAWEKMSSLEPQADMHAAVRIGLINCYSAMHRVCIADKMWHEKARGEHGDVETV